MCADLGVVVAYGGLVPPAVLAMPAHGWVNLHFSDLPRWRGAAPVQWAVLSGDPTTASCVFALEEGLDTGPVYSREPFTIGHETSGELLDRMAAAGGGHAVEQFATGLVADGEGLARVHGPRVESLLQREDARGGRRVAGQDRPLDGGRAPPPGQVGEVQVHPAVGGHRQDGRRHEAPVGDDDAQVGAHRLDGPPPPPPLSGMPSPGRPGRPRARTERRPRGVWRVRAPSAPGAASPPGRRRGGRR